MRMAVSIAQGRIGRELNELVRRAETIIVLVLPAVIDIKAREHFMAELLEIGKQSCKQARLAVVPPPQRR